MKATLAVTLLLLCAGALQAQVRLTESLNKAILEEESQHNLPAAVTDYQQVLEAFDEERKTAAAALFRLAECQRKLHHDEQARAAYQRIVREFTDQGNVVEQSRIILAATYRITANPPAPVMFAFNPQADEAKKRYRSALTASIALAQSNEVQTELRVRQGLAGPEAVDAAKERTLKLQRELAMFDMGILPDK